MAISSISSAITATFVQRLADEDSKASSIASSDDAVKATLSGLQRGVKVFSSAMQGLNALIEYINVSREDLKKLSALTDEMIQVVDDATKSGIGSVARQDLNERFLDIGREFQKIIKEKARQDYNPLDESDLKELFRTVGFDESKASSFALITRKFVVSEDSAGNETLASDASQAERPVAIPQSAYTGSTTSQDFEFLFDDDRSIATRPSAYRMLADLNALKEQLDTNSKAIDEAYSYVADNIFMVRSVGLSFLNASQEITSAADVDAIVESIRDQMRESDARSLRQLNNLDAITTAALTTDFSTIFS